MRILWLSWKDNKNPEAGGAEAITNEICRRLVLDGHEVIQLTAAYPGCISDEFYNGYRVIRRGGKFTVYFSVFRYFLKTLRGWPELIIDECNTLPFFSFLYGSAKKVLFIHQLAREIWFYQMPFPVSLFGYVLEPLYLKLYRRTQVITVSNSTKNDLIKYNFKKNNIGIIREGVHLSQISEVASIQKLNAKTLLYLGSLRPMKKPEDVIIAFNLVKVMCPDIKLIIAGTGKEKYVKKLKNIARQGGYDKSIQFAGKVSEADKLKLLGSSSLLLVTSVREGWGLIVTEGATQGTPAIVYDVPGLRDSVINNLTGIHVHPNPKSMAISIYKLFNDSVMYNKLGINALENSRQYNFNNTYNDFVKLLDI